MTEVPECRSDDASIMAELTDWRAAADGQAGACSGKQGLERA